MSTSMYVDIFFILQILDIFITDFLQKYYKIVTNRRGYENLLRRR